jgi:hypothetical protein
LAGTIASFPATKALVATILRFIDKLKSYWPS